MPRPMTITEKILAAHAGLDEVEPGQLIECDLDIVLANDVTAPIAIKEFRKIGVDKVWDAEKIALVPDHYTPNKDIKSAEQAKMMREFAHEQGITHYYEIGCMGVEHALLPEQGVVVPGDVIIGADSPHLHVRCARRVRHRRRLDRCRGRHGDRPGVVQGARVDQVRRRRRARPVGVRQGHHPAHHRHDRCRRCALSGDGVHGLHDRRLDMDDRMTICNMAIEAGGKSGIIAVDDVTARRTSSARAEREWTEYYVRRGCRVRAGHRDRRVGNHSRRSPSRTCRATRACGEDSRDIVVDQVVIGSCTNGRIEDMRIAAKILEGRKVHPDVRLIVIPATQEIYRQAMHEGLFDIFLDAGRCGLDADVRPVPRWSHGHPGGGGACGRDDEPQLRRADGRSHERGLPCLAGRRRCHSGRRVTSLCQTTSAERTGHLRDNRTAHRTGIAAQTHEG